MKSHYSFFLFALLILAPAASLPLPRCYTKASNPTLLRKSMTFFLFPLYSFVESHPCSSSASISGAISASSSSSPSFLPRRERSRKAKEEEGDGERRNVAFSREKRWKTHAFSFLSLFFFVSLPSDESQERNGGGKENGGKGGRLLWSHCKQREKVMTTICCYLCMCTHGLLLLS